MKKAIYSSLSVLAFAIAVPAAAYVLIQLFRPADA